MSSHRIIAVAYGYAVCLAALVLFAYALLTLAPSSAETSEKLKRVNISVFDTDTSATTATETDTSMVAIDTTEPMPLAVARETFDEAVEQELQDLRSSKKSFEDARSSLEEQREKLLQSSFRLRLMQKILTMLFAAVVFVFHWRWLRGFTQIGAA